jgi:hypothetical protein
MGARPIFARLGVVTLAATLVAAAGAAQSAELTRRTTNVFGNFTVGYATVGDSGSFSQLLFGLESAYGRDTADAGAVNSSYRGTPVEGSASFASGASYVFGPEQIVGNGSAATTGATPYDYVSLGANAISTVRLEFRVSEPTPFVLSGAVVGGPGVNVGTRVSEGLATVQFTGCIGCLWRSDAAPGEFSGSGTLIPGITYALSGNASSRINGSASYVFNLQLAPVPEPGAWALLAAGLPLMLWRQRRRQARCDSPSDRRGPEAARSD